ncbi:pilin [Patescibacteria group bacterium]|nr:pilin [Patescibacteria group bacterium]
MKKILPISLICLTLFLASAQVVFGVDKPAGLNLPDITIQELLKNIFNLVAQIVATLAALTIVIGGIMWMTAGGDDDQVTSARKMITAAVIGLIIVGAAVGIVTLVLQIFGGSATPPRYYNPNSVL